MHVTDDFLEIRGGHCDDTRKLHGWNVNAIDVQVNQIQLKIGNHLLVGVKDFNAQAGGVGLLHIEHDALIIGHHLDELEKVNHIYAQNLLGGAVELVKPVGPETEVDHNRVSAVQGRNLEARGINFQVGVG